MTIAVTGSSGFFAKYVIMELLHHGYDIVAIDIRPPTQRDDRIEYIQADVQDLDQMKRALRTSAAVIHLAGIPHPLNDPADLVYRMNSAGTFTTAWAAGELGIRRFLYASSESVLGTAFHPETFDPLYFPISEQHPTLPLDPYGISKVIAEHTLERCAERFGLESASLRMPWIWGTDIPEGRALYHQLITNYKNWKKNLWAFVDARDAARAFRLALSAPLKAGRLERYYIVANQTWVASEQTTRSLIEEFFPDVPLGVENDPYCALISNAKAKVELGWEPQYSVMDLDQHNTPADTASPDTTAA